MEKPRNLKFALWSGVLSAAGAVLSSISLYHYTLAAHGISREPSFCNINAAFNCDLVNSSPWSVLFGLPLAAYGLAFYLSVFLFSLLAVRPALVPLKEARNLLFLAALPASVASLYLFYVSEFLIGTLCLLCVGMYLVNFGLLALSMLTERPFAIGSLGSGLPQGRGARLILIGCLASVIAAFSVEPILASRARGDQTAQREAAARAVAEWRKGTPVEIQIQPGGAAGDYARGPEQAPIQIVEFSDFECPACKYFYTGLEKLMEEYPEKIRLVIKNYPLDPSCNLGIPQGAGHHNACYASYVARCAGEQDKFWQAADYLFGLERSEKPEETRAQMEQAVQVLGLDPQGFAECIAAQRTKKKIQDDLRDGARLGVAGTPAIWINGKPARVFTSDVIRAIFNDILEK